MGRQRHRPESARLCPVPCPLNEIEQESGWSNQSSVIVLIWSERQDLNLRPLDPQSLRSAVTRYRTSDLGPSRMTAFDRRLARVEEGTGRAGQQRWARLVRLATDAELQELETITRQAKGPNASDLPREVFRRYHAIVAQLVARDSDSHERGPSRAA